MLRRSGLRSKKRMVREDIDPMSGITNLVDIMLVFSCGLMVAIVTHWNVDLSKVTDVIDETQLVEIENVDFLNEDGSVSGNYESKGVVVKDPKTGKMYVISKGE